MHFLGFRYLANIMFYCVPNCYQHPLQERIEPWCPKASLYAMNSLLNGSRMVLFYVPSTEELRKESHSFLYSVVSMRNTGEERLGKNDKDHFRLLIFKMNHNGSFNLFLKALICNNKTMFMPFFWIFSTFAQLFKTVDWSTRHLSPVMLRQVLDIRSFNLDMHRMRLFKNFIHKAFSLY